MIEQDIAENPIEVGDIFVYGADVLGSPGLKFGIVIGFGTREAYVRGARQTVTTVKAFTVSPYMGGWEVQGRSSPCALKPSVDQDRPKPVTLLASSVLGVESGPGYLAPSAAKIALIGLYNKFVKKYPS